MTHWCRDMKMQPPSPDWGKLQMSIPVAELPTESATSQPSFSFCPAPPQHVVSPRACPNKLPACSPLIFESTSQESHRIIQSVDINSKFAPCQNNSSQVPTSTQHIRHLPSSCATPFIVWSYHWRTSKAVCLQSWYNNFGSMTSLSSSSLLLLFPLKFIAKDRTCSSNIFSKTLLQA